MKQSEIINRHNLFLQISKDKAKLALKYSRSNIIESHANNVIVKANIGLMFICDKSLTNHLIAEIKRHFIEIEKEK